MVKLTIELEGRELFLLLKDAGDVATVRSHLKETLTAERGWFSFDSAGVGWIILSSDQLRKAFIKMEECK